MSILSLLSIVVTEEERCHEEEVKGDIASNPVLSAVLLLLSELKEEELNTVKGKVQQLLSR